MDTFISIAISLLYTIILYGSGPLLFLRFRKKAITRRRLKAFSIAYSFAAWFLSNLFWAFYSDSDVSSGGAAIFWGCIFYAYMKREFGKTGRFVEKMPAIPKEHFLEQETSMGTFTVDTETGEVVKESNTSHDYSEARSKPVSIAVENRLKKNRKFPLAVCVLSCLCVAAMICAGWAVYDTNSIRSRVEALEQENADLKLGSANLEGQISRQKMDYKLLKSERDALKNEKERLRKELDFCVERISFLVDQMWRVGFVVKGSQYYHYADCDVYSEADEYWAHNVEYCEYLGYSRCPKCWEIS